MANDFPEMESLRTTLQAKRASLVAESAPLRKQRDALVAQITPLEAALRKIDTQIKSIERPRLAEIDNQLAALARAMGARSMSDAR